MIHPAFTNTWSHEKPPKETKSRKCPAVTSPTGKESSFGAANNSLGFSQGLTPDSLVWTQWPKSWICFLLVGCVVNLDQPSRQFSDCNKSLVLTTYLTFWGNELFVLQHFFLLDRVIDLWTNVCLFHSGHYMVLYLLLLAETGSGYALPSQY